MIRRKCEKIEVGHGITPQNMVTALVINHEFW